LTLLPLPMTSGDNQLVGSPEVYDFKGLTHVLRYRQFTDRPPMSFLTFHIHNVPGLTPPSFSPQRSPPGEGGYPSPQCHAADLAYSDLTTFAAILKTHLSLLWRVSRTATFPGIPALSRPRVRARSYSHLHEIVFFFSRDPQTVLPCRVFMDRHHNQSYQDRFSVPSHRLHIVVLLLPC